jgi:hypothetical protein
LLLKLLIVMYLRCLLFLLWSFMATTGNCQEQAPAANPEDRPSPAADSANEASPDDTAQEGSGNAEAPRFLARVTHASGVSDQDSMKLRLGDYVKLKVLHLSKEMKRKGDLRPDQLRLFVNDIVLEKVKPISVDTANGIVVFPMIRNQESDEFWRIFYQSPKRYESPSKVGIGSEVTQIAFPYPASGDIQIVLIRKNKIYLGLAAAFLLGVIFFWLSRNFRFIKEDWSKQFNRRTGNFSTVPFSLSKVQLVFWTFLIVSGYFTIWLVTGELPTIPETILALLGISISEKIVGKFINASQDKTDKHRVQDNPSKGFFQDVLEDENGFSIARLQFVIFNLIIGASFIRNIIKNWSLLDIDPSSLVLLTISGAGYLIMKNTENSNPAAATDATATAATSTDATLTAGTSPAGTSSNAADLAGNSPDGFSSDDSNSDLNPQGKGAASTHTVTAEGV